MRTLVAIPVYNEQKYVESVLKEVGRYAQDILVIDDGSTDETPLLLARQPVEVIRHAVNRGYGRCIRDAFRWATCYGYDWLITMDCDLQHEPASLPEFEAAIRANDADRSPPQFGCRHRPGLRSQLRRQDDGGRRRSASFDTSGRPGPGDSVPGSP